MRGVHFSLRWLFGVVSFLAVGCGSLVYASPLLSKLAFTASVTALVVALGLAVYRRGEVRAFWAGFAAFGMLYLWLVCGTWQSPDGSTALRERLVTTDLLIRCHDLLPLRQAAVRVTPPPAPGSIYFTPGSVPKFDPYQGGFQPGISAGGALYWAAAPAVTTTVDRVDFLTTGHSLFVILFAFLGGVIIRRCARRGGTP